MDIKDPKIQKLLLIGAGLGALIYFYLIADYVPINYQARAAEINKLKGTYAVKMGELTKAQQLVNRLPELKKEFELLNQRWAIAQELLPTQKEVASLLRKITIAGQESGVRFTLFRPGAAKASSYFTENPVQVSITGGFHRTGAFLGEISDLSRLVNVTELKLRGYEEGDLDETVQADFVATAYTLPEGNSNESAKQSGPVAK